MTDRPANGRRARRPADSDAPRPPHADPGLYRPATFDAAGVALPLAMPGLDGARVRPAVSMGGGLEVVIPGWTGGSGALVLSWSSLPVLGQMNAAGRALHRDITRMDAPTPERMRLAAAVLALTPPATGRDRPVYGEARRAAARRRLTRAATDEVAVRYHLMMRLLLAAGIGPARLRPMPDLDGAVGRALVREAFAALGARLSLPPETIYDRTLRLGSLLQPLGFAAAGQQGRLRRQMAAVEEVWQEAAAGGFGPLSRLAEGAAVRTLARARTVMTAVDQELADPVALLRTWGPRALDLRRRLEALGWLLDGWEPVRAPWGEAEGDEAPRTPAALLAALPLLPRAMPERFPALPPLPHRRVRAGQDWRTGAMDTELARRMGYPLPSEDPTHLWTADDVPGEPLFPGTVQ